MSALDDHEGAYKLQEVDGFQAQARLSSPLLYEVSSHRGDFGEAIGAPLHVAFAITT